MKAKQEKIVNKNKFQLNSDKIKKREKNLRIIKISLTTLLLFFISSYFVLRVVYEVGEFTITLDSELAKTSGIVMFESLETREYRKILKATKVDYMDNISINWLPSNLNDESDGSHNGDNYLAYTFYVENQGAEVMNYWYSISIDDVVKNVDKAIRVMIYLNGEKKVYAKPNESGNAENGTEMFYSETKVCMEERKLFKPGDIDKITFVVFIEGDDPDCVDELIGGEMKMHMDVTEEHILQEGLNITDENEISQENDTEM